MKTWHVFVTLIVMVTLRLLDPFLLESARLSFFDSMQRTQDVSISEQIVLVDIDEKTLDKFGQYPIPRKVMADEIDKIDGSIIAFNILFSEEDRMGGDEYFADILSWKQAIVAIAPSNRTNTDYRPPRIGTATFGDRDAEDFRPELPGMLFAQPIIHDNAFGYGTISSAQDVDGIVRRQPLLENFDNRLYPAFALDVLRVAAGDSSYQISTDDYGIQFVRIPKFKPITTDVNGNVTIAYWNEFKRYSFTELDQIPEGSIIIVGATFEGSNVVSTPMGAMYPHDIQANLIKTMIDGVVLKRQSEFMLYEIIVSVILSVILIAFITLAPISVSGMTFGVILMGIYYFVTDTFSTYFYMVDPVFPILTMVVIFAHGSFVQFYTQFKAKQMIKGQFGTYLSPDMVDMLAKDPSLMKLGGERKEMTFLFMDICGFTPISEHYKNKDDAEGLVTLINNYLNEMTNIILNNGGTIDKYMGDCIMAFWNAPLPCDNHAEMAVKSAIEIEEKTNELRQKYQEQGLPPINVGTGINTGTCIVGNMGSESRFDYSVIGDSVNLAARLEATAARGDYLEYKTIYSSFTMEKLTTINSRPIGQIKVKGKEEMIDIYTMDR
jgi:adenylate cyclase|tara:strand:- start:351 stop:2171 length:1821 start_codon:yes stop_codon:yes gene_type:complete